MQNIPFFNYPEIYKENEEEYRTILNSTCKKGAFIMQKELAEFENHFQNLLDANMLLELLMEQQL